MANEIYELKNFDAETASEQELRDLVNHLKYQISNTYAYWVGEWAGARRAKSARNGAFVSKEEIINYLNGK